MARKNQAAVVELDLVGHEVSRRHTRFPVPVLDNATFALPATTNIALDTSPHGESQDLLGALERSARVPQLALNIHYGGVRASEEAPPGPFRVLERRHGLAEIVERGGVVLVTIPHFTSNASRRVVGQWGGAGGAICEDHFGLEAASVG